MCTPCVHMLHFLYPSLLSKRLHMYITICQIHVHVYSPTCRRVHARTLSLSLFFSLAQCLAISLSLFSPRCFLPCHCRADLIDPESLCCGVPSPHPQCRDHFHASVSDSRCSRRFTRKHAFILVYLSKCVCMYGGTDTVRVREIETLCLCACVFV